MFRPCAKVIAQNEAARSYLGQEREGLIYAASLNALAHPSLPVVLNKEMIAKTNVNIKTLLIGVTSKIVQVF